MSEDQYEGEEVREVGYIKEMKEVEYESESLTEYEYEGEEMEQSKYESEKLRGDEGESELYRISSFSIPPQG